MSRQASLRKGSGSESRKDSSLCKKLITFVLNPDRSRRAKPKSNALDKKTASGCGNPDIHATMSSNSRVWKPSSPRSIDTVNSPTSWGRVLAAFPAAHFSSQGASTARRIHAGERRYQAIFWDKKTLIPPKKVGVAPTVGASSSVIGKYRGTITVSWPCRRSSATKALSRKQLPQYMPPAPGVIWIRFTC